MTQGLLLLAGFWAMFAGFIDHNSWQVATGFSLIIFGFYVWGGKTRD